MVVKVDDELDHWVWFEHLERKWSISKYGSKGNWRYRHPIAHPEQSYAEQYDEADDKAAVQFSTDHRGAHAGECSDQVNQNIATTSETRI